VAEPLVDHSRVPKPERKGVTQVATTVPSSPPLLTQLETDHNYFKHFGNKVPTYYGQPQSRPHAIPAETIPNTHFNLNNSFEDSNRAPSMSSSQQDTPPSKRANKVSQEPSLDDILAQKLQQTQISKKKVAWHENAVNDLGCS
jgi:hypothetical protein